MQNRLLLIKESMFAFKAITINYEDIGYWMGTISEQDHDNHIENDNLFRISFSLI